MSSLRLAGVVEESIVDGPGIRYTIFAQGCPHHCPGCHNPQTHNFTEGYVESVDRLLLTIQRNSWLDGVTFSGGEPFQQAAAFGWLGHEVKKMGLSVVTYTGYTVEQILARVPGHAAWKALLEVTDLLIDGPYVHECRNIGLLFRGSSNQRLIDPAASLKRGQAVEWTGFKVLTT